MGCVALTAALIFAAAVEVASFAGTLDPVSAVLAPQHDMLAHFRTVDGLAAAVNLGLAHCFPAFRTIRA